jgi:hypothetical protein
MNRNNLTLFLIVASAAVLIGIDAGARYYTKKGGPLPIMPRVCTQEAKQCPDGSYVSRVGPNCDFQTCSAPPTPPPPGFAATCHSDADCPSSDYTCAATEGIGTVQPGLNQSSTFQIISGVCKKKVGSSCNADTDCSGGLLCHFGSCTNPIGRQCAGLDDASCPSGYQCVQSCGPPVIREGAPPPPYFCELNKFAAKPKICPICLASNTNISTPAGQVNIKNIKVGSRVWSQDQQGRKIASTVVQVSQTLVPKTHHVIHLMLADSREVWVSPSHPTITGAAVQTLRAGDWYDGSEILSAELIPYWDNYTYDLLPDSGTGFYWANGIILKSTLVGNPE